MTLQDCVQCILLVCRYQSDKFSKSSKILYIYIFINEITFYIVFLVCQYIEDVSHIARIMCIYFIHRRNLFAREIYTRLYELMQGSHHMLNHGYDITRHKLTLFMVSFPLEPTNLSS